ncbi:hypothetical protein [Cellulomonas xiejunii]|uniref:Uncharacterized protein n=1 Tax=Cellulomonas xiejunii TaxID=2968083 RepID=A0ABY5KNE0_9CELL|nr:hypothetical protein [Cellulomonas xiejunii]MCC2321282.1 hypothetical protein [Cellulomonas xiejunii]UUI71870.1 hypothetical protein NP048_19120 [Cellulomonas xiejunii]
MSTDRDARTPAGPRPPDRDAEVFLFLLVAVGALVTGFVGLASGRQVLGIFLGVGMVFLVLAVQRARSGADATRRGGGDDGAVVAADDGHDSGGDTAGGAGDGGGGGGDGGGGGGGD